METTKELTRFEMAVIKRTAQNTKSLRTKRDKIMAKMSQLKNDLESINTQIEMFEAPIKEITGGRTSEEVLNGVDYNVVEELPTDENYSGYCSEPECSGMYEASDNNITE
jgi:uncharacterized coiled-coil DUF342 family protein